MKVAVVGHVEWIRFARVEHAPAPGEIAHSTEEWEQAGGPFDPALIADVHYRLHEQAPDDWEIEVLFSGA